MSENPLRVVVVGAGITGMACAHRLQERLSMMGRPFEIFLIEASNRLGGIVETIKKEGFLLEKGPDSFLAEKPRGVGLCNDLALTRDLISTRPESRRSFIVKKNKLHPIPRGFHILAPTDVFEMMTTRLLSIKGKFRLLKEFIIKAQPPADETLSSFVRRRFGNEVLENLAQPIVNSIYGADPGLLSMRATFPQFLQKEDKGSLLLQALKGTTAAPDQEASGARYSLMMSFKEGMQTFITGLGVKMTHVGVQFGTSITQLQGMESGWRMLLSNKQTLDADAVCLALPSEACASIVEEVSPRLAQTLRQIPLADSLSVYFALKKTALGKKMDGAGLLVPESERKSFTACTFVHNKFAGRVPEGYALLRTFIGGKAAGALWGLSDTEIERRVFTDLRALLNIQGAPLFSQLYRYRKGLPHYTMGHLDRIDEIRRQLAALPTLALAGNWRQGVGVPDCIDSGERAADQLMMDLCRI
jgi:oxygen-dependent protoporphyrinogen oxidase